LGAIVALTAAVGLLSGSLTGSVSAQTAPSVLKACSSNTITPGGADVRCDLLISSSVATSVGSPITLQEFFPGTGVNIVNAVVNGRDVDGTASGFTSSAVTISCFDNPAPAGPECDLGPNGGPLNATCTGSPAVTITPPLPAGSPLTPAVTGVLPAGDSCVILVSITLRAAAGATAGPINEQLNIPGSTVSAPFVIPISPIGGPVVVTAPPAAATTTLAFVGCAAGTNPLVPAFAGPGLTSAGAGATLTCRLDLDDNDATPDHVSSGTITFSVSPAGSATVTPTAATTTAAAGDPTVTGSSIVCGRGPNGEISQDDTCNNVDFTVALGAGLTPGTTVTVTATYTPDSPALNTSATATLTLTILQPSAIQPTGFAIACTAGTPTTLPAFLPGPIGGATVVAVSILPSSIGCTVQTTVGGVPTAVANGTITVSTVTGTLIDARGALSTELRIPCANNTLTAPNNCTGVTFAIAGAGVGFVEVLLRYEPVPFGTNVGTIAELESRFVVAFVAPIPNVSLLLSPNPVAAGQDTTATFRLNRVVINCGVGIFCVNPTTGLPLLTNTSSILNGTVVMTIDNTAIARFQQTGIATAGTTTTGGTAVIGSPNQVTVRCGTLSPVTGSLEGFFGGCDTATANIRALVAGVANVTAQFIPDLPGAIAPVSLGGSPTLSTIGNLTNFSGANIPTDVEQLVVLDAPATGNITLARGCNNVTPTVTESVSAFIARVKDTQVFAVWEHQAATNTFLGAPGPGAPAGAPADLSGVTRLRPVFVCVNGAGRLEQPPA
jgi:hypothetical protein